MNEFHSNLLRKSSTFIEHAKMVSNEIVFEKKKGFLAKMDLFGTSINLNFEKAGSKHKTRFGGICSVFIWTFMLVFLLVQMQKVILLGDNYETMKIGLLDSERNTIDQKKEMKLENMKVAPFFILTKQRQGETPFYPDKQSEKYVKFYYE